ncbi:MAG: hypothetical protein PVG92_04010 [Holophagae bacterium]
MSEMVAADLTAMDGARRFLDGSERATVELLSATIGRGVYQPGWRWSEHAGRPTGRPSEPHLGLVESGQMVVRAADGTEAVVGPGGVFEVGPGHDAWVLGDEPCIAWDVATRSGDRG